MYKLSVKKSVKVTCATYAFIMTVDRNANLAVMKPES